METLPCDSVPKAGTPYLHLHFFSFFPAASAQVLNRQRKEGMEKQVAGNWRGPRQREKSRNFRNYLYCWANGDIKPWLWVTCLLSFLGNNSYLTEALVKIKHHEIEIQVLLLQRMNYCFQKGNSWRTEYSNQSSFHKFLLTLDGFKLALNQHENTLKNQVARVLMLFSTTQLSSTAFITAAGFKCAYLNIKSFYSVGLQRYLC